jgi:hypothetical protein
MNHGFTKSGNIIKSKKTVKILNFCKIEARIN